MELATTLPFELLFKQINSKSAVERSAAIKALSIKCPCDHKEYISSLLSRLCVEKALYTKIELCNALESGNKTTVVMMCEYLGQIGSNQHKVVPDTVSKKISFPLPRDIIARSLARMDVSVLSILMDTLEYGDRKKVVEVIDAVGFMIFYHQELATFSNLQKVQAVLDRYPGDNLILWKIVLCCSAFPRKESIEFLDKQNELASRFICQEIKDITSKKTIIAEIARSRKLTERRMII